jgi:hypothetical protein
MRERSIRPVKPRAVLADDRWVMLDGRQVDLDTQARPRRRQQVPQLIRRLHGKQIGQHRARLPGAFLHGEVAGGQVQVQASGGRDRTQGVMRRDGDVARLAPASHLAGLGDAADDAQIDPGKVDQILLDRLAEVPLGGVKFFVDMGQPTTWGTCTDLGGRISATVFSIVNTAGTIGGVICPIFFGVILSRSTSSQVIEGAARDVTDYNPLFMTVAGMYILAGLCWFAIDCTRSIEAGTRE